MLLLLLLLLLLCRRHLPTVQVSQVRLPPCNPCRHPSPGLHVILALDGHPRRPEANLESRRIQRVICMGCGAMPREENLWTTWLW